MARHSGFHHSEETKAKMRLHHQPKGLAPKHTPESRGKISAWKREWDKTHSGPNHFNWNGGRTGVRNFIRKCPTAQTLKLVILKRDKYTCQLCGKAGGRLEIDHIRPFAEILDEFLRKYTVLDVPTFSYELYLIALKYKPLWDKTNLRTLCQKCNRTRKHAEIGKRNENVTPMD